MVNRSWLLFHSKCRGGNVVVTNGNCPELYNAAPPGCVSFSSSSWEDALCAPKKESAEVRRLSSETRETKVCL